MLPHKLTIQVFLCLSLFSLPQQIAVAQQRKPPAGGRVAVVVDERLAALRATPELSGRLVRRLGRGRLVAIRASRTTDEGVAFFLVNVTSRTHGWIQREAVVSPSRRGDDERLWRLINASQGFDRIARARIFLDYFRRSPLRPEVLLLLGNTAEELAAKLSDDAVRRLNGVKDDAPEFSYFMNYSGLDRYNRQGIGFIFHRATRRFHYDGVAWRELVRRYPNTPAAVEAKRRLDALYSQLRIL